MRNYILLIVFTACISRANAIQDIRWGSSGDPLNGLNVTWRNNGTADSIRWGYSTSFEEGRFAAVRRTGYLEYFFTYTFPTVTGSSKLYYKLYDSNTKTWSAPMTFATAPPTNTTVFSFIGIGDSRSGMSVWNQVSTLANKKKTDFSVYTGDIVNSGSSTSDWSGWFTNGDTYIKNNLIYHSLGNHDAASVPNYTNTFDLPKTNGSELYYAVSYGNAIIIALNSESPGDAAQNSWLVSTLQANQNKTWKIVFFHKPFYTIGSHAGEMNSYYNTWWKAFDDYGVDLILNGHDHMYERTKPINRKVSTTAPVSTYGSDPGQGRCQIVCGGAGAPLYTGTASWFIQKYQSKYNFCKFNVNGSILCDTTFDNTGAVIETFCIDKTSTAAMENNNQVFHPMSVVPNPVEGSFTMKYSSPQRGEAIIKLYDLTGRELLSKSTGKNQDELEFTHDMSGYAKGVYTIQVIVGNQKDDAMIIVK